MAEQMATLKEIEEHTDRGPLSIPWRKAVRLLIRAVRQLGAERKAYQSLFEATDDLSEDNRTTWPELGKAYDEVMETPEPDADVLALLEDDDA